jgi:hypothetical protein
MSDTPTSNTDAAEAANPVDEIAKSLAALDAKQVQTLFSLLTVNLQASAPPQTESQRTGECKEDALQSSKTSRRPARTFSTNIVRLKSVVLDSMKDPDMWSGIHANLLPWMLALLLTPLIVQCSFSSDRAAASARLSIEYALLSASSLPLADDASQLIQQISRHAIYREYVLTRGMSGQLFDIAMFSIQGSNPSPITRSKLKAEVTAFIDYIGRYRSERTTEKSSLATLSENKLRLLAFPMLNHLPTETSSLRDSVSEALDERIVQIDALTEAASKLNDRLPAGDVSEIQVKLTLLNKGATDGLVRNEGWIIYRDHRYEMERAAPPSTELTGPAVPVFQTNPSDSDFSPQSVGKIETDAMTELWYTFSPEGIAVNPAALCGNDELIKVILYDQNNKEVSAELECKPKQKKDQSRQG